MMGDLRTRLRTLVSDWQANSGSRPLGDPTAHTWGEAATQLLDALNSPDDKPDVRKLLTDIMNELEDESDVMYLDGMGVTAVEVRKIQAVMRREGRFGQGLG